MRTPTLGTVRSLIAGALAASVLAATPAPPAGAATDDARSPDASGRTAERASAWRVGTFNINADTPLDRWRQAVLDFADAVDLGALQEAAGKDKAEAMRRMPGIDSYRPTKWLQEPIFWDSDLFSLVDGRPVKIAAGRRVESKTGSGLAYQQAGIATVARLRSRATGATVSVVNVHLLSGAVNGGRALPGYPRRTAMYLDEVRNLGRLAVRERRWAEGPVYVLGDFNNNYTADKKVRHRRLAYATMRRAGLVASWEARRELRPGRGSGSRAGAYLDVIWSDRSAGSVTVRRDQRFRLSDHFPVISTYSPA